MSRSVQVYFEGLRAGVVLRLLSFTCGSGILALMLGGVAAAQNPPAQPSSQNSSQTSPPADSDHNYRPSLLKKTPPNSSSPNPAKSPDAKADAKSPDANPPATNAAPAPNSTATPATGIVVDPGQDVSTTCDGPLGVCPPFSSPVPSPAAPVNSAPATPVATPGTTAANTSADAPAAAPNSAPAASSSGAPSSPPTEPAAEMVTHTSQVPLESHVNLVPVRVIVHDGHGHPVGDLREADFEIRQDGKPQVISHFSLQTPESLAANVARGTAGDKLEGALAPTTAAAPGAIMLPTRFVALVVDDADLTQEDLVRMRLAAIRYVEKSVKPTERIALYTVSGQSQVDFTDDREKVVAQLKTLTRRPVGAYDPEQSHECLKMSFYQADLIQNKNDQNAQAAAQEDALNCALAQGATQQVAQVQATSDVVSTSMQVLQAGEFATQYVIRRLDEIVRRVSAMPGQRSVVFMSPGFLTTTHEYEELRVVDRAAQSNVFINTLDARGLYTVDPIGDISQPAPLHANSTTSAMALQYRIDEQRVDSEVLWDLAASTGGFYFRNNNDLDAGLLQTASEPEVSYLLAFVPSDIKNDGRFHTINVKMLTKEKYTVQARRGFFAPKHGKTPDEVAKQDIEDAVFSQEEAQGLPVRLNLQYFKTDDANARLSVLTHVDVAQVHFGRDGDRNTDDLTIVAALFDRNGNFLKADQKTLEMKLKDTTLEKLHQNGVTVKTNFDVKPGGYLVRLVVRDARDSQIASRNGVVDIP